VVQGKETEANSCSDNTTHKLGSDSGDESKVSLVGMTGKIGEGFDCRSNLFHIRVIMRHTKVDKFIDNGSQSNLIS
jgi:hypothetical protein